MNSITEYDSNFNPLISIVTPVLNGEKYLVPCIESVLTQSYQNIEHLFIDGCSTDNTLNILTAYSRRYPGKIKYISEPDRNAEDACNKGLILSKGDIIAFLGADDMCSPEAINTVVNYFRLNPEARFVFGDCDMIDEDGKKIGKVRTKEFNLKEAINYFVYIPTTSAFYKREVLNTVGLLYTDIIPSDFEYFIRIGKLYNLYRIRTVLSRFRLHQSSTSCAKNVNLTYARACYIHSRRHGASILSFRALKYGIFTVANLLDPILGFSYPYLSMLYVRLKAKVVKGYTNEYSNWIKFG